MKRKSPRGIPDFSHQRTPGRPVAPSVAAAAPARPPARQVPPPTRVKPPATSAKTGQRGR